MSPTDNSPSTRTADAPLHVVHVVLSMTIGGLERNVLNQVREGQKLGQRVSLVCLDEPGLLAPQVEALGADLVAIGRQPGLRPGMILKVRRVLRAMRPDVVHTHQLVTLLYGGAAARLLRVPVVVHTEHQREAYATRRRTRLLGRLAGRFCDRFYCLTAETADELAAARIVPDGKIRVIQNGIDVARFLETPADGSEVRKSLGIPADAPLIGTVGRLYEVKRQEVLIRAFARLRGHAPSAHLMLVGDGPRHDELCELAASLGLADCVHFTGFQPHSGPFLRAMDIFALTSRSEGMPQAVLEASVSELPVVASRVGGLPEVIDDRVSGILFESGDDAALANILRDLLADPDHRRRLGAAARARVEKKFSVARMASEYHRDFLDLLRQRRSGGGGRHETDVRPAASLALEESR